MVANAILAGRLLVLALCCFETFADSEQKKRIHWPGRKPDTAMKPPPQDHQLMSKHHVLGFKPQPRLKRRGQHGQKRNRAARSFRQLRRFLHRIKSDKVFGTHTEGFLWEATAKARCARDLWKLYEDVQQRTR